MFKTFVQKMKSAVLAVAVSLMAVPAMASEGTADAGLVAAVTGALNTTKATLVGISPTVLGVVAFIVLVVAVIGLTKKAR